MFIAPVVLHDYPAGVLSVGRYLAFGLLALPLAWLDRRAIAQLTRADWIEAAKLSLVGNLLYYAFLAAAIQMAGAPLPTVIIGTLPVVIAITANISAPQLRWRSLVWPLGLIALGIGLVNRDEWQAMVALPGQGQGQAAASQGEQLRNSLLAGGALAALAVVCWTWYPIRNSRWLQLHPGLRSNTWATAQGLATLPLALAGALLLYLLPGTAYDWPLGPRPMLFVAMMLAVGLLASWLGTLLWNRSSKLLPASLAGQMIVFETLAALLYAFILRQQWPSAGTWLGIALLVLGVLVGVRLFNRRA